jgi:cephalosporin hydroxylase
MHIEGIDRKDIIRLFHKLYYNEAERSPILNNTRWMGQTVLKCPLDMWVYQEIMWEINPAIIIETGTYKGGSAVWFADMLEKVNRRKGERWGRVISIDIKRNIEWEDRENLTYLNGSSISDRVISELQRLLSKIEGPVMVVLDSDHRAQHVFQELELYSRMVTKGSYLIVEDTNINGNPVLAGRGKGPGEAIASWLPKHPDFEVDRSREKFLCTMSPGGFIRRVS